LNEAMSDRLKLLGRRVSDVAELLPESRQLAAARTRWLDAPPTTLDRRDPWLLVASLCACVVAALLFVALIAGHLRPTASVAFVVGAPPVPATLGDWIAARTSAAVPIQFSEGSLFTLGSGATLRVTETRANSATLLLEKGKLGAAVVHGGPETHWGLVAGPFELSVAGAVFDASWDPAGQMFELAMHEGVVVVKGPLLHTGRELHAGDHLRVSLRDGWLQLRSSGAPPPALEFMAPARGDPERPVGACASDPAPRGNPSAPPSPRR
jgi:hypothetical protein